MDNHICSLKQIAKELLVLSEQDRDWIYSQILDLNLLDKLKLAVAKQHDENLFFYTFIKHQYLVYDLISGWPASLVICFLRPFLEGIKLHNLVLFEKLYAMSVKQITVLESNNKLTVAIKEFLEEVILDRIQSNNNICVK